MQAEWELAVRSGDLEAMRRHLAAAGERAVELVDSKDKHGQTALMLAAVLGREAVVELLIERGAALNHTAKFGLSALMLAVINNHAGIAGKLVRAGADTSLRGSGAPGFYQKTAFGLAHAHDRNEIVELLSHAAGQGSGASRPA
jgi:ankyrin repeat protein